MERIKGYIDRAKLSEELSGKIYNLIVGFDKLELMREIVKTELEHIPRGDYVQNKLRQVYWKERMHSLQGCDINKAREIAVDLIFDIPKK